MRIAPPVRYISSSEHSTPTYIIACRLDRIFVLPHNVVVTVALHFQVAEHTLRLVQLQQTKSTTHIISGCASEYFLFGLEACEDIVDINYK